MNQEGQIPIELLPEVLHEDVRLWVRRNELPWTGLSVFVRPPIKVHKPISLASREAMHFHPGTWEVSLRHCFGFSMSPAIQQQCQTFRSREGLRQILRCRKSLDQRLP